MKTQTEVKSSRNELYSLQQAVVRHLIQSDLIPWLRISKKLWKLFLSLVGNG